MRGQSFRSCVRTALAAIVVTSLVAIISIATFVQPSLAAEKHKTSAQKHQQAVALVEEALNREMYGADQQRDQLLAAALVAAENYEPARWHQGYVREHKQWVKFDALPQMQPDYLLLAAYHTQRDKTSDTVAGQLELGKWCESRGLTDQARAHLTRVLELEPDNPLAHRLLGHRRVGERWITPQEVEASAAETQRLKSAFARWSPKLKKLLARLDSPSKRAREAAAAQLKQIDDPSAIPVIEALLSRHSEQVAGYAVDSLASMSSPEASVSLARYAVFAPWESVRRDAAQRLKDRPLEEYVPALLGAMQSPVQTRQQLYRTPDGQLNYRYAVYREGRDHNEIAVFDSSYVRAPITGGDANATLSRAMVNVASKNFSRDATLAQQNDSTARLNTQIASTLIESTGQNLTANPADWWKWWDDYNEVFVVSEKPTSVRYQSERVVVEDSTPQPSVNITVRNRAGEPSQRMDCLAAGTPVWTETGAKAIETVRIGDRVLSQDPATGELAYKPVLRTTIRPVSKLTQIHLAGDEAITTSGGHLFWCSGEGWVRSRNVTSGMLLHTVDGPRHVSFVEQSREEQTYNLIVADFNTYFVGDSRVLSHDNTISHATANKVPGLVEN